MKIGIDIDGVIFDTERALRFYADYWSYFTLGKDRIKNDDFTQEHCFNWTEEEKTDFYENQFNTITENANLMIGAKEILAKLKEDGHKLYLITLRGYYREGEKAVADKKLKQIGVEFDGIFWAVKDKADKCKELGIDVMIEDNPDNILQYKGKNISVLYLKEEPSKEVVMQNVTKVNSWMDIYRQILKLSKK